MKKSLAVESLVEVLEFCLSSAYLSSDNAEKVKLVFREKLEDDFGGFSFYIPKNPYKENKRRNVAIRNDFNGRNYAFLVKKYNLSHSQIRNIVRNKKR